MSEKLKVGQLFGGTIAFLIRIVEHLPEEALESDILDLEWKAGGVTSIVLFSERNEPLGVATWEFNEKGSISHFHLELNTPSHIIKQLVALHGDPNVEFFDLRKNTDGTSEGRSAGS